MSGEIKGLAEAEQSQADFRRQTEVLQMTSRELFEASNRFTGWQLKLEELIKTRGTVEAQSHDERNYNQTFHFKGNTEAGENPIIGELKYGDDFHKGDGTPKLLSYTCYRYGNGKEVVRYETIDGESMAIRYHEEVNTDGSKIVKEQKGLNWITTKYDSQGNQIEKEE